MKFGKKTIALIGAVAMLSSVAACGSTSAGDGGSTGSSDKKVELTVVLGFHTASYGQGIRGQEPEH